MAAKILTIFNPKGGVGKSGTSLNAALYAAKFKIRTMIIDNDAQQNTTRTLTGSVPKNAIVASMLFADAIDPDLSVVQINKYLDLIPADKNPLKNVDSMVSGDDIAGRRDLYNRYRANVRQFENQYDLIIIDTPTTAEHRYTSALVASDFCIAPATMEAFGMDGVQDLKEIVRNVKARFGNPRLKDIGIMANMVSTRSKLHQTVLNDLEKAGIKMLPVTVPMRSDVQIKLHQGKRSPVMLPAVTAIFKEMGVV